MGFPEITDRRYHALPLRARLYHGMVISAAGLAGLLINSLLH